MHKSQGHLDALAKLYTEKSEKERGGLPFAFVPVTAEHEGAALGVAEANTRGYSPIPEGWACGTFPQMQALADELNKSLGLDKEREAAIICSTMGGRAFVNTAA